MIFQNSLGIDFREDRLYLVYLQAAFTGVRFKASAAYRLDAQKPLNENVVRAGEIVNGFIREHRISNAVIHLGIPRRLAVIRTIELPIAVKENLENTLRYEMEKYIPLPVSEIHFSCQIVTEDKETNKIGVFLAVVKKKDLEPFIGLATLIQEGLSGIEIGSTAIVNFLAHGGDLKDDISNVSMYDDGAGMEIDVVRSGHLFYSRTLEYSENTGLNDAKIMAELEAIQKMKAMEGTSPRLLILNGEKFDETARRVKEQADNSIEVAHLDMGGKEIPSAEFIPAFGLAIRGLANVPMKINLLPRALRKKPGKVGLYVMIGLLCAVLAGALVWGGSRIITKRNYLNLLNQEIEHLEKEVKRIEGITDQTKQIENRFEFLNALIQDQIVIVDVLKVLTERIPEGAWINIIQVTIRDVQIEGQADSASELVSILENTGKLKDVAFLAPITKDKNGKEKFRIGFKVK